MSEYNLRVRFILSFLTLISVFSIPIAHAEQSDVWDFRNTDHLPDGAQSLSSVTRDVEGIHIKTDTDGFIFWGHPLSHPVDILTLRIRSTKTVDPALLWHPMNVQDGQLSNYFHITGSGQIQNVQIAPRDEQGWDWTTDQMALGFPAHADMDAIISNGKAVRGDEEFLDLRYISNVFHKFSLGTTHCHQSRFTE